MQQRPDIPDDPATDPAHPSTPLGPGSKAGRSGADGGNEPRVSRRALTLGGLALAVGGVAGAGALLSVRGSDRLDFWSLFTGGDGERLVEMTDAYAAANPDQPVDTVTLAWGAPYYTKLAMSATGGQPPDLAIVHTSRLAAYAPAGLLDPFDPALLEEFGMSADAFIPALWESGQSDGAQYAIPLDTHPIVLYYNPELATEAGLADGNGTLNELVGTDVVLGAFRTAQQHTGDLGLAFQPTDNASMWRLFWTCYRQLGGADMLNEDATEITMDDDIAIQALEFMGALTEGSPPICSPDMDYAAAIASFSAGRSIFHINGEWEITSFVNSGMAFDMVPIPDLFGTGSTAVNADSHAFVLPRQPGIDDDRRRTAYFFIQQMLEQSYVWSQGGHIPAYRPVLESDEYRALTPQSNYASAAENAAFPPRAWFAGSASELETQVGVAAGNVMRRAQNPEQALQQARSAIRALLDTRSPIV